MKRLASLAFASCWALIAAAQTLPYRDSSLSAEQRADDLLGRLTLEEKTKLMMDVSPAIERLGIPQFQWWNEALHGVGRNGTATVFPITMCMAASWDDALVEKVFTAVSDEARAKNQQAKQTGKIKRYQCLSFWTPNINIFRDPRWGRGQETYGEDPYLTSKMGVAVVRGLQGPEDSKYRKLLACAKHFAVHSGPEWNRHTFNIEELPERDLWETYLPAFKALVQEAHVAEVMCAYQRIDGQACCAQSRYEQQILRDEWGFKGLITSDCGAVRDFLPQWHNVAKDNEEAAAKAVLNGTDVECGSIYKNLPAAVKRGDIKESDLDRSLRRLLIARFQLGDFDDDSLVEWTKIPASVIASEKHKELALKAANEGIVLLKNDGILPLKKNQQVVVVGPNAADSTMMWGNYNGTPTQTITALQGIHELVGRDVKYVPGCTLVNRQANDSLNRQEHQLALIGDAETVIFVGGISPKVEGEEMKVDEPGFRGGDRTDIELPLVQRELLAKLHEAGKKIIFVCCSGGAMGLLPESKNCNAIVQAWYGGELGGRALASILYGDINPSGKLPVTFYKNIEQLPDFLDYRMTGRTYRYFKGEPLYPFGYGLSYTTFKLGKPKYKNGIVTVSIKNTGHCEGTEVVQVYVRRTADKEGPLKTLRAYQRVMLKAGESRKIEIPMPRENFELWDEQTNTMRVVGGEYELFIGTSSAEKDLQKITTII